MTGRADFRDRRARTPPAPRIGVVTQDFAGAPEPDSAAALEAAARPAERARACRALALPRVRRRGLRRSTRRCRTTRPARRSPGNTTTIATSRAAAAQAPRRGAGDRPRRYDEARRTAHRARGALRRALRGRRRAPDLLGPGARRPRGLGSDGQRPLQPALDADGRALRQRSGPMRTTGLPVGVQVIAPFGRDALKRSRRRIRRANNSDSPVEENY